MACIYCSLTMHNPLGNKVVMPMVNTEWYSSWLVDLTGYELTNRVQWKRSPII